MVLTSAKLSFSVTISGKTYEIPKNLVTNTEVSGDIVTITLSDWGVGKAYPREKVILDNTQVTAPSVASGTLLKAAIDALLEPTVNTSDFVYFRGSNYNDDGVAANGDSRMKVDGSNNISFESFDGTSWTEFTSLQ